MDLDLLARIAGVAAIYLVVMRRLVARDRRAGWPVALATLAASAALLWQPWQLTGTRGAGVLLVYVGAVLLHQQLVARWSRRPDHLALVPVLYPIAGLLLVKVAPLVWAGATASIAGIVGISYMAFRLCQLAIDVGNEVVPPPTPAEHLAFAFFPATMVLGPISGYPRWRSSVAQAGTRCVPIARALLRILIGVTKLVFFAELAHRLTFAALWGDMYRHGVLDFAVSCVAGYLFLYWNFSGCCDVVIGYSAMIGLEIEENFDRPFSARNLSEFWARWHMTLSVFMRGAVFLPLSTALGRRSGGRYLPLMGACSALPVFLLIGLWHGLSWNCAIWGLLHGAGIAVTYGYAAVLRSMSPRRHEAYLRSRLVRAVAIVATFSFVSLSFFVFDNTLAQMHEILRILD